MSLGVCWGGGGGGGGERGGGSKCIATFWEGFFFLLSIWFEPDMESNFIMKRTLLESC